MFDPNDVTRITLRANGQDYTYNVSNDPNPLPGDPVPEAFQNATPFPNTMNAGLAELSQHTDILSGLAGDGADPAPTIAPTLAEPPTMPPDLTPTARQIGQYKIQHLTGGLEPIYYYPDSKSLVPDLFFSDGELVFRLPWPPAPADAPYSFRDLETFDFVSNEDGTKCGFVALAEEIELDPPSFHQILATPETWQPADKRTPVQEPIRFYVSNE